MSSPFLCPRKLVSYRVWNGGHLGETRIDEDRAVMKNTRREGGFSDGKDGRSIGAREQDDSAPARNKLNILNCRLRVCLQSW